MAFETHKKHYVDKDKRRIFLFAGTIEKLEGPHSSFSRICEICKTEYTFKKLPACQICGRAVCLLCSAKYYFPVEVRGEKDGLTRICLFCRDQLLLLKQERTGQPANLRPFRNFSVTEDSRLVFIPPEVWAPKNAYKNCFQCGKQFSSSRYFHNCRICGELIDNSCSAKLELPYVFERKTQKINKNKKRVCLDCRFYLSSGIGTKADVKRKEFSEHLVKEEWKNRVIPANKLQPNLLFPREIRLLLVNDRNFPEMPEYILKSHTHSFQSTEIQTEVETKTIKKVENDEDSVLVVSKIFLTRKRQNKTIKDHPFNVTKVEEVKKPLDLIFEHIGRQSIIRGLKKVKTKVNIIPEKEKEDVFDKHLYERYNALNEDDQEITDDSDWE